MSPAPPQPGGAAAARRVARIGCVSFINSKPLIDSLQDLPDPQVRFDVPSGLLEDLVRGEVDIALCPVADYFRSPQPLRIVPVGGIACEGPTLTVRLFSRVPFEQITEVYADTDSHTSVNLMRVLLDALFGLRPQVIDYNAREQVANHCVVTDPATVLLIGDKVVTAAPPAEDYPHQMDLGEAWNRLTGLPFVFAVWMARQETELGDLPQTLEQVRLANMQRIDAIVERYAAVHGWEADLATRYFREYLRFAIGPRELEAIARFGAMGQTLGLWDAARPLVLWTPQGG